MFVNVSPTSGNAPESLCSLNFAARCRAVTLGKAGKNLDGPEVVRLRKQVEALQEQLRAGGGGGGGRR